jgi:hypothetical protein
VQGMALSAWDRLVAAMSPLSDFAAAERERGAAELEAIIAELDRDDREREAEIAPAGREHGPDFADRFREALLERSEHNRERAVGREPPGLELGL